MNYLGFHLFAHAFGARYDLPIPLFLFILGGAGVVLLSFMLIVPRAVKNQVRAAGNTENTAYAKPPFPIWTVVSFITFIAIIACGLLGSQKVAENILPTLFWLIVWIAIPLSCGLLGDWTKHLNPVANIARLANSAYLRRLLIGQSHSFVWPTWLKWWPAVLLYFVIACGELIYNQIATLPLVTAATLLVYFCFSGIMGLLYGSSWLKYGEVFSVLFATWGRLGYFRLGTQGRQGFAGGLATPFTSHPSQIAFILFLLVSVGFDGLLATPLWMQFQHQLPSSLGPNTLGYEVLATLIFLGIGGITWLLFTGFATMVAKIGHLHSTSQITLAGLLPSLLPISFGYLLAHNIQYLVVNSQLLFPLIGNPIGSADWPIQLIYPFNDSFEPRIHLLSSGFYWYFSVIVIIAVHIIAIVLAHRYLGSSTGNVRRARQSEYPWVLAMVAYTMFSLWLLAQPLIQDRSQDQGRASTVKVAALSST